MKNEFYPKKEEEMTVIRVKLWTEEFDKLTSGKVVSQNWVEIILADIWYAFMIMILEEKLRKLSQQTKWDKF